MYDSSLYSLDPAFFQEGRRRDFLRSKCDVRIAKRRTLDSVIVLKMLRIDYGSALTGIRAADKSL